VRRAGWRMPIRRGCWLGAAPRSPPQACHLRVSALRQLRTLKPNREADPPLPRKARRARTGLSRIFGLLSPS
jgi:hypothetical protein